MPKRALQPCSGCGTLVRASRCPKCQSGKFKHQAKTRQQRGYGKAWDRIRKQILSRDLYRCVPCHEQGLYSDAYAVDHIKPKSEGGTDEPDNLRSICKACHAAKTAQEGAAHRWG